MGGWKLVVLNGRECKRFSGTTRITDFLHPINFVKIKLTSEMFGTILPVQTKMLAKMSRVERVLCHVKTLITKGPVISDEPVISYWYFAFGLT